MMRSQWGDRFEPPGDEMIVVDSPTTTNHYHSSPRRPGLARWALALAIAGPLGTGLAAAPFLFHWLSSARPPAATAPAPAPPPADPAWDLRLGKP